ncbi:AAA family ATPase [Candidatus Woesearchaeota archaeon]|nr:AAA family ATPase [Candidatus Woesearchaeota archaeon]
MPDKEEQHQLWIEKYRPKTFAEVKGHQEIVKRLQAFVEQKNIPHILLSGPAGCGKTTLALIIARTLFGETWQHNFLEMNSSDDRGIQVVRETIKDFARTRALGTDLPKIILLDECDSLTKEAQQALRRTMETFSRTARFILSCITPETKILLPEEVEISIEEFMKRFENKELIHIQNFNKNVKKDELVLAAVKLNSRMIGKKVYEIKTNTGRVIRATGDHKFLTSGGWKEVKDFQEDDELLVYPSLEGTVYEEKKDPVINKRDFMTFLTAVEKQRGLKSIQEAKRFCDLCTIEKYKILNRIRELKQYIENNKGLTEREFEVYMIIKRYHKISRFDIQKKLNISRIRTVQILQSIERKEYIKRKVNKKIHSFEITDKSPLLCRNDMHIKRIIEKEFKINISYTTVYKEFSIKKGDFDRTLFELDKKNIFNINYNDYRRIGALARICGVLLGDGHLAYKHLIHVSGNKKALSGIKKDFDALGYHKYSRIFSKDARNTIRGRAVIGKSTWFYLNDRALSLFFEHLGIPRGDKVVKDYTVPTFIKAGTKFVKREFLRGLFGSDAYTPRFNKYNCCAVMLRQNKIIKKKEGMLLFYRGLQALFKEFQIETYIKILDNGEIRTKDNEPVYTFALFIKAEQKNMFKFLSRIGYAHEDYKDKIARIGAEYLRYKLAKIEKMNFKRKNVPFLLAQGFTKIQISHELGVSLDFVNNSVREKETHLPRKGFPTFDEWKNKYVYGNFILNSIDTIKEVDNQIVMDLTCNKDHHFISQGFISHNCNFSSKIIDPIQSRCTIFRFKPLEKEAIKGIINHVAQREGLKVEEKALEAICTVARGDVRRAENILQSCSAMGKTITEKLVYEIVSAAHPEEMKKVLMTALEGDFLKARNELLDVMLKHGLSGEEVVKQIQEQVWHLPIPDKAKMQLIEKCGEAEFRMVEGSDEFIQLEVLLSGFVLAKP